MMKACQAIVDSETKNPMISAPMGGGGGKTGSDNYLAQHPILPRHQGVGIPRPAF
jgi:hypothetical protein